MDGMQLAGLIVAWLIVIVAGLIVIVAGILGGWIIGTAARDVWAEMRRQDEDENESRKGIR